MYNYCEEPESMGNVKTNESHGVSAISFFLSRKADCSLLRRFAQVLKCHIMQMLCNFTYRS